MAITTFIMNETETDVLCLNNDYMKDICSTFLRNFNLKFEQIIFLYKGNKINKNYTFKEQIKKEDKEKNKIIIFCIKINPTSQLKKKGIELSKDILKQKEKIKPKNIICSECGEMCQIKFNDFKITLYDCKNGHKKENISLEEFNKIQYIDKLKIKCDNCKYYKTEIKNDNKQFYKCLKCNKNLCNACKEAHNKNDNLIEYELQNYICNIHNKKYNSYCNKCKKDLCIICENKHKKENNLIYYKDIIPNINYENNEIEIKFDKFFESISIINEILNKVINKIKIYYKIYSNIIDNLLVNKINYQIINNINEILCYNKKVLNEIDKIIDEVQIDKKIINTINLFNNLTEKNKSKNICK